MGPAGKKKKPSSKLVISNPFGGDPGTTTTETTNPFGNRSSTTKSAISNPFGGDPGTTTTTTTTNPFGNRSSTNASAAPTNNPFGDDDNDKGLDSKRHLQRNSISSPPSTKTNPFGEKKESTDNKLPSVPKMTTSPFGAYSNPFEDGDYVARPTQELPQQQQQKSPQPPILSPSSAKMMRASVGPGTIVANAVDPFESHSAGGGGGGDSNNSVGTSRSETKRSGSKKDMTQQRKATLFSRRPIAEMMDEDDDAKQNAGKSSSPQQKQRTQKKSSFMNKFKKDNDDNRSVNSNISSASSPSKARRCHSIIPLPNSDSILRQHQKKKKKDIKDKRKKERQRQRKKDSSSSGGYWPYDNYEDNTQQYNTSKDVATTPTRKNYNAVTSDGEESASTINNSTTNNIKSPDRKKKNRKNDVGDQSQNIYSNNLLSLQQSRPPSPPDLRSNPALIQNLPLTSFESMAKERAKARIVTWLYDAGLTSEEIGLDPGRQLRHNVHDTTHHPYHQQFGHHRHGRHNNQGKGKSLSSSNLNVIDSESFASSRLSAEGMEVIGQHGQPIATGEEGHERVQKEMERFRASAIHQLNVVDARLNDGVAASGAEVQELVDAVMSTRGDLERLRELGTYDSDDDDTNDNVDLLRLPSRNGVEENKGRDGGGEDNTTDTDADDRNDKITRKQKKNNNSTAILAEYPLLRGCVNARRNLSRCFRELEFFSQIPAVCDRLRGELQAGEWTEEEYAVIRDVAMEHVELEILLVEAEAGMKERILECGGMEEKVKGDIVRYGGMTSSSGASRTHDMVDQFLSRHVKNVWELGEEIRVRILSGIGTAFDLALRNSAGMVALVEAVEVYERASEQCSNAIANGGGSRLRFTDMRAAALSQLFTDFELRGLEVFRAIHMQAADCTDDDDAGAVHRSQFNGVLRASTELVIEIDVVKKQMAPCFAPHWHVEMLWSSCVAHVCSNQIVQQIGGPEGNGLPDLTVTQLLDLVAWVEFFRETVEGAFPSVAQMREQKTKTYFDTKPDLFHTSDSAAGGHGGNGSNGAKKGEVNVLDAIDNLAWANNMLWEVHRLAQDEFLVRVRSQIDEYLGNIYRRKPEGRVTPEGRLVTNLAEDVFDIASAQLGTIREKLTGTSDALVVAVCLVFSRLRHKQIEERDAFLSDLENCCAAANDFQRMAERAEDVSQEIIDTCGEDNEMTEMLESGAGNLVAAYGADAVYAAMTIQKYVFHDIEASDDIGDLFGVPWEKDLTHNEIAVTITTTLTDFMDDMTDYLDEFMLKKAVDALVKATVVFYVRSILLKAEKHSSNKHSWFQNNEVAMQRMDGDIRELRMYFDSLCDSMPALTKVVDKEFEVLTTIHELLCIAAGLSESDAGDFVIFLHKRVKDVELTKHYVGDLWHLVKPTEERAIWEMVESMEDTMNAVCPVDASDPATNMHDRMNVPGLRLDEMMVNIYMKSKRNRPVKPGAIEKMAKRWKINWTTEERKDGKEA